MLNLLVDLFYFGVIAANFVLAILMFYRGSQKRASTIFSLLIFCIIGWIYSAYSANYYSFVVPSTMAGFWTKAAYFASIPIPALFFYFVSIFPENRKFGLLYDVSVFLPVPVIWALTYLDLIVKGVLFLPNNRVIEVFGPLIDVFVAYFFAYLVLSFWMLIRKYRSKSGTSKMQIAYVLVGCLIPVTIAGTTNLVMPVMGITYGWDLLHKLSPLSTVFFTIFVSSAVIKYKFTGFNYVLGRGVLYAVLASSVTMSYFLFLFLIARFFQGVSGNYSFFVGLLFFFMLSLVFTPFRTRLEKIGDKLFSRSKLDYEFVIGEITSEMNLAGDIDKFLVACIRTIVRKMGLSGGAFFIFNEKHDRYDVMSADGTSRELLNYSMTPNYPVIEFLKKRKKPAILSAMRAWIVDPYLSEPEKDEIEKVYIDMKKLSASACVPSIVKGKLIALLMLGPKLSGEDFEDDDINFTITLANQIAIFLENAFLLTKEKESVMLIAQSQAKERYVEQLEKANKDLLAARQELVKAERLATVTRLSISLQHEINNPLTSVLAITQALLIRIKKGDDIPLSLVIEKIRTVQEEAERIKALLKKLSGISDPIIREYMPGVEMIDINASQG